MSHDLDYLLPYATPRQREFIEATKACNGNMAKADAMLGVSNGLVSRGIMSAKTKAAAHGAAPGHFNDGTAPGYRMGKVTIQRGPSGVERVWERQHPEQENLDALMARCEERLQDFPRFAPLTLYSTDLNPKLVNFLGLFDLHIGERISSDDPKECWDIATAKTVVMRAVDDALARAPRAEKLVLCFGGDAIHYDGLLPVTPKSRHVLHSDGDFDDMVDAVLDVAVSTIDRALAGHNHVYLIWAEGNHDEASSVWMRKLLARVYSDEPRLTVVQSKIPWYALLFGKVMIGVGHGHKAKLNRYPGIFANMFREMWGMATYAYSHRGHEHHYSAKEQDGMLSTQHPSLAPSDDYASGLGLTSRRGCLMVTYHEEFGEVERRTVRPEMLMEEWNDQP